MCDTCGCGNGKKTVVVERSINEVNDALAEHNSQHLSEKNILCVNIMGAPGCGKTSFIEALAKHLPKDELAVIQGDLESDIDKRRLEALGIYAHQINTHSGCHLSAQMINKALMDMDLSGKKYLLIENVGNLVCPAQVKLGQHMNIVISSTTEGSDKPRKYPLIFLEADAIVISKIDLAEAAGFSEKDYLRDLKSIGAGAKIIKTSSKDLASFKDVAGEISHKRHHMTGTSHNH